MLHINYARAALVVFDCQCFLSDSATAHSSRAKIWLYFALSHVRERNLGSYSLLEPENVCLSEKSPNFRS